MLHGGQQCGLRISIHALRKESDPSNDVMRHRIDISIHALRKESDYIKKTGCWMIRNFNPRSP